MGYVFLYLSIAVIGYIIGSQLRKRGKAPTWVGKLMTVAIVILIFIMGSRIGDNRQIIESLDTIGLVAFVYTFIIMAFAVLGFTIARRLFGFDRYGVRHKGEGGLHIKHTDEKVPQADASEGVGEGKKATVNTLTILIVAFVVIGMLAGYFVLPDSFMAHSGDLLTLALCFLVILIGMDVGIEGTIAQNFKNAGWRVIAFPFVSILSMFVGSVLAALVLPITVQDSLCIGSGLGWYSLAPAMLAEYSTKVSAISFLHNVLREIFGIILAPIIAKKIGYLECYAPAACTCMDVSLPVIERSTNSDVAVYSIICGAVLSASVPILVSIFMSL